MRDRFVSTLMGLAEKDPNVHLVTGDLGFGVLKPFWERFPDQFTNAGIAEQNMTSFAAGMALEGRTVFTYSIGNFPTLRAIEQIRNDCAYHEANVKIVCVGGGFTYGSLGMSHHATEDLAIMRALPNVTVMAPSDAAQAQLATEAIYAQPGTCYLRLGRGGEPNLGTPAEEFEIGKALPVSDGEGVALLFTGAIGDEVIEARDTLAADGHQVAVVSFPTVKPIDVEAIVNLAQRFDTLVTVEEHNVVGGLGGSVAEVLAELPSPRARLARVGLDDRYSSIVGTQKYLRDAYGMSARAITERVRQVLNG
ncbi:transketolase family protein [Tessaracoccus flavus]|uniref:Transketolase n=1 Tax=Tessaracoccus flavus TaxID=1610493 RepID=A0A1Q2CI06_9ACTN|nr:transketolase C-terminal domain-containing protein [Tessaracoccus flavus]AQP45759.1 transketolase [Tessaracoccus flavus]SDZ12072.1 transketolase subunit B [Tessaracoccus flavus]